MTIFPVLLNGLGKGELTMVTPIDAIRFHSNFGEAASWLRAQRRDRSNEADTESIGAARGAIFGLFLGGLMWVGIIAFVRAVFGV